LLFALLDRMLVRAPAAATAPASTDTGASREPIAPTALAGHVVLVGHGRVGSAMSPVLKAAGRPLLVIESDDEQAAKIKATGIETIAGNAADPDVIAAANLSAAHCLIVAVPDAFEGGQVVEQARTINPALRILARSHSDEETAHLTRLGATLVVMGEQEIARAMIAALDSQPDIARA
jgi:CPA2 family monovalent cation:H+ antiporter-2